MNSIQHIDQLIEQEMYGDAIATIERAIANSPDDSRLWCRQGRANYEAKNFEQACLAFERATLLSPLSLYDQI